MSGEMVRPTPGRDDAAAAVESLVLRGDLSALGPAHRAAYYLRLCEQLGLNPHAQPFAFLRLNGKEVLYATRGATDQLAAIHRLNREIIDGPKVIDLAGTKLVIAVCRATHPNGRFETATATVPLTDPVNVLMKAETKAKRRATLSILGLGLLDEMELETIPAKSQEPGGGVDLSQAAQRVEPENTDAEPARDDHHNEAEHPEPPPAEVHPVLEAFYSRVGEIELPGEGVSVWMKHRAELGPLNPADRENAWKALCKRVEDVGKMKNAKVWLKKAIAEEDARRSVGTEGALGPGDDDDPRPRGGRRTRAGHDAANAHGSEQASGDRASASGAQAMAASWEPTVTAEGVLIEDEAGARAHLAGLHPRALEHSYARHAGHAAWRALVVEYYRRRCGIVDARLARQRLDTASTNEPAEGRRAA